MRLPAWRPGGWSRRRRFAAAVLAGLVIAAAAFGGTWRLWTGSGADASSSGTVLVCKQGRCVEQPVSQTNAPVESLTPAEEVARLGRQPPTFNQVAEQAGVAFQHSRDQDFFNLGGGAAAADFNGDGWLDLYVTNSKGPNALYRNNRDGTFSNIAPQAGVANGTGDSYGAAWGDYNNDGLLDLYVANYGSSRLFRNNGDETFTDVTEAAGVSDPGPDYRTTGAVWGDYDGDGNLDLLVVRHIKPTGPMFTKSSTAQNVLERECREQANAANPQVPRGVTLTDTHDFTLSSKRDFSPFVRPLALYHNNGDGTFENVTSLLGSANVYPSNVLGAGFKPTFLDYDNDGDFDIYVVNDFGDENIPNVLWRNDGPGPDGKWQFTDVSASTGANAVLYGMGLAVGDYDNDGDLDLAMTDIGPSQFYENRDGQFVNVTERTGTGRGVIPENGEISQSIGWGTSFADFDNDGWLDLYVATGYLDSDPCGSLPNQPNALFMNMQDGTFADVSKSSGTNDPGTSREVVTGDFNNDGLVDVYVVNIGNLEGDPGTASLFINTYESDNHWLDVSPLNADGTEIAIGAKVKVTVNGVTSLRYAGLAQGHMSQSVMPVHFGLGTAGDADVVEITWPSGATKRLENVPPNQLLKVKEPK